MSSEPKPTVGYGRWPSPITPESMRGGARLDAAPRTDGSDVYWLDGVRQGTGAVTLMRRDAAGGQAPATPDGVDVRSTVGEYGGGPFGVAAGIVVACDRRSGRVLQVRDGVCQPLTPQPPAPVEGSGGGAGATVRFAGFEVDPVRRRVYAVREDHRAAALEPVNELVMLDLEGANEDFGVVVVPGRRRPLAVPPAAAPGVDAPGPAAVDAAAPDFVLDPTLSPDGRRLAWVQWDHPAMPWDGAQVWAADVAADGTLTSPRLIAGGPGRTAYCPVWLDGERLAYLYEPGAYRVPHLTDLTQPTPAPRALAPADSEYGLPPWVSRMQPMCRLDERTLVVVRTVEGFARLTVIPTDGSGPLDIPAPVTVAESLAPLAGQVVCHAGFAQRPAALVAIDRATGAVRELTDSGPAEPDLAGFAPMPESVWWDGFGGAPVQGFFYPPTHPEVEAPAGTLPPLMVMVHGGPTSCAQPMSAPTIAFFTSRGIAVLDVNYSGSTGFGRAYRERLEGQWGVADVADCVAGARWLVRDGRVDPDRLAIRGGSAGGLVVLSALASAEVFTAGVCRYGIAELAALVAETHKFESRYNERLIAPWPAGRAVYEERSPLYRLDAIDAPLLLLHGRDDMVVPVGQAEAMAQALRQRGREVELVVFDGEGHGFRDPANLARAWHTELAFLRRCWGL